MTRSTPNRSLGPSSAFLSSLSSSSGSSLSYLTEPPSFTHVSDPHLTVSLKGLLKKDAVTKTRGLEELLAYVQAHPFEQDGGVEEPLLTVWVQLYPRISIDNSRRVRELSHNVQSELLKSARKRMERYIPKSVGPWLAGIYDRDRLTARAAQDGLSSFLTTPEKVDAFWKRCQAQILDYAIDAIRETKDTLSDERSTTKEDAEAKYFRVTASSLSLVLGLIQRLTQVEMGHCSEKLDEYFSDNSVWNSITYSDSQVRKAVCQLLFACLDRDLSYTRSKIVKQAFVTGGLRTNQAGSALEYVRALTKLTQSSPEIWVSSQSDKKSPFKRLQAFLAKGSQGSPPTYWTYLESLLLALPAQEFANLEAADALANSLKLGITNRDEPRAHALTAWKFYVNTLQRQLSCLPPESQPNFAKEHMLPLLEQLLFVVPEKSTTLPLGSDAHTILLTVLKALLGASQEVNGLLTEEWTRLGGLFVAKISGSLPEVSRDYQSSQNKISEEGRRWFALVGSLKDDDLGDQTEEPISSSRQVIMQSIAILENRNLKPFGAARILEHALTAAPRLFSGDVETKLESFLTTTAGEDTGKLTDSSSLPYLTACLGLYGSLPDRSGPYSELWKVWCSSIIRFPDGNAKDSLLATLIAQTGASALAQSTEVLQQHIIKRTLRAPQATTELLDAALTYDALRDSALRDLISQLVNLVSAPTKPEEGLLIALENIAEKKSKFVSQDEDIRAALLSSLLSLTEVSDHALSTRADGIKALLDSQDYGLLPVVNIIQSHLENANQASLEIETLVRQAVAANAPPEDMFPNTNVWMKELMPFLQPTVDPSLSITNLLRGAVHLVPPSQSVHRSQVKRDRRGRGIPLRMALFTMKLSANSEKLTRLPSRFQIELLYLQYLTVQLVSDQLTLLESHGLWDSLASGEEVAEAEELVSSSRGFLSQKLRGLKWWESTDGDDGQPAIFKGLVNLLLDQSQTMTPQGFYSARVLGEFAQAGAETPGSSSALEGIFVQADMFKTSQSTVLPTAALMYGLGDLLQVSKPVNNLLNRLISDVAGASAGGQKTNSILVLLDAAANVFEPGELPVANNRIVFAVRQVCSWLQEPEKLTTTEKAECCRSLSMLLPCMHEVYGPYWETVLDFILSLWNSLSQEPVHANLSAIHASLKLTKILENMSDPNDDLKDALKDFGAKKPTALIRLLKAPREHSSQPQYILDSLLCREVDKVPVRMISEMDEIFALVASDFRDIQTAAFSLLHRAIPVQQEQKSIDLLLDKKDARLPDELLSLLLDAPSIDSYPDEVLAEFPSSIRCYLLAWQLVFDAYTTSSFKIRNDLTENLRAENCANQLLDFLFDVLGHSVAQPLNLAKENISGEQIVNYDLQLAEAEPEEKNMQWLLVHLFYQLLKYCPGLFRRWYLDCRSKQTKIAVESWTTKYFSPLIVSDTLDEVQSWADNQEAPAADEQELVIKISRNAREITAGYEIDESQALIAIKIPPSYPIDGVTVAGINRVAVSEKKWQSWVLTTQGVITFSNGNIVDGLQVFKRNISGAMKGQAECAICYSIISTDKRMPDKKCTTCKNLFHRSCLYKWFQTSNQNTCPLCRNPIDYLGADTQKRSRGGV